MLNDPGYIHIKETMEKFNICSNIPINAYRNDGKLICSIGYTDEFNSMFDINDIYDEASIGMIDKSPDSYTDFYYSYHTGFTTCSICPKSLERGIYVIGPYMTSRKSGYKNIEYKPKSCIPFVVNLLRDIGKSSDFIKSKRFSNKPKYSLHVKKAVDYIEGRYYEDISLTDICNYLNISKCYFCTIFRKETGETFSQFVNKVRVEKSKNILLDRKVPIVEVALSVGFNNQNYYNMSFKKITKKTPLEFRNTTIYGV